MAPTLSTALSYLHHGRCNAQAPDFERTVTEYDVLSKLSLLVSVTAGAPSTIVADAVDGGACFLHSPRVQALAIDVLGNYAFFSESAGCHDVVAMGGLVLVLTAMQRHTDSPEVQTRACLALYNLAYFGGGDVKAAMVDGGAVPALKAAIDAGFDAAGCGADALEKLGV